MLCNVNCKYCYVNDIEALKYRSSEVTVNKYVTMLNVLDGMARWGDIYNYIDDVLCFQALSEPFLKEYDKYRKYFMQEVAPLARIISFATKYIQLKHVEELKWYISEPPPPRASWCW